MRSFGLSDQPSVLTFGGKEHALPVTLSGQFRAILMILALFFPVLAIAQSATSPTLARAEAPRIGFVDVELVLSSSRAIRSIMQDLDTDLAEEAARIDEKKREARGIRLSLEQQGSVLSEAERQKRQQQALDLVAEVDEMEFRFSRRLERTQRSTVEPLLEQVIYMIADVGEKEGFDLIVRGEMVLYGRATVDLTPAVIREVDGREKELRGRIFPAQPEEETRTESEPLPMIP